MKKVILSIEGMTCSACSNGLEKYLNKQSGVKSALVNLVMATASIEYMDNISILDLERYIKEAGFTSLGIYKIDENYQKKSIRPFIIYGLLAIFLMYISMADMIKFFLVPFLNREKYPINYALSLLILTIPFLYYGFPIIKSGIKNLYHKIPNMDTLVGLGIISSFFYSLFGVVMILLGHYEYVHKLYFESCVFVIYFVKLGRYIDSNSKEKTKDVVKNLVTVTPLIAKLKTKSGIKEVTIDEVKKDDILICLAGDKIAVDGEIVEGVSYFDEAFITGESKPIKKKKGDNVIAGSINYDTSILYKAKKIGKESMISEIIDLVIHCTNTKTPISLLADKISSYFVPIILILAIFTFIISTILGVSFSDSLTRFVTVLVVACPCALGLATPLAVVVSEGSLIKKGIFVKSSEVIEKACHIDTIVLDKTGTLTNGSITISKIYNYSDYNDYELLSILGSIEYNSTHPIAKSIIKFLKEKKINYKKNIQITNISGLGIKANMNKKIYYAGSDKLLNKLKIKNIYKDDLESLTSIGNSIVYIVEDEKIIGLVGISDTVRESAKELVNNLEKLGIDVVMATGDNSFAADIVAKELGISNVISSVLPIEKVEVIKKLKSEHKKIIMVGDGINDAPSLVLADIGISISSGTDIATNSAAVILMKNDLLSIIDFIYISKKTIKNIKQNLFWAFLYNICMIPIAMGLFTKLNITINPMIACISMIISSLFVIFNALRLKKL